MRMFGTFVWREQEVLPFGVKVALCGSVKRLRVHHGEMAFLGDDATGLVDVLVSEQE